MYHGIHSRSLDKGNFIWQHLVCPNAVGVFNDEGPPVPIPNTEVKLTSADDTCLATGRKNRSMPTQRLWQLVKAFEFASLAQQVEHAAVNRRVVGSNPTGGATNGIAAPISWRQRSNLSAGPVAQLVEQPAHNRSVRGSSP